MIGTSLSEPHTSGSALQDACVSLFLFATIYRQLQMRINISQKFEHPCALCIVSLDRRRAMLGYCQSAALANIVETAQVEAHMAPCFLFVIGATDQSSMAGCSQSVQIIHAG